MHKSQENLGAGESHHIAHIDTPAYRRDIDGIRAIAVSAVVLYHAGLWPLQSGYMGVDIFFIISGFLIGGILDRETRAGTFSFAAFYTRRARRILPALLAVVSIVSIASLFLMGARELELTTRSAATSLLGISNVYFWWSTNYFAPSSHLNPFLMTWSLGVEEQFYIFFPIILIFLARYTRKRSAIIIGTISAFSFATCVAMTMLYPTAAFYLLPTRAWELGLGALLAILWSSPARPSSQNAHNIMAILGSGLILVSLVLFDDATPFPGAVAALPVTGTLALILSERSWLNRKLLSSSGLVGIGLVSYSWYLWHAPLMAFVRLVTFGQASVATLSVTAIISLGCAILSWRFIERPFRRGTLSNTSTLWRYGAAVLVSLVLIAVPIVTSGLPQRLNEQGRAIENTLAQGRANPCLISYGATTPSADHRCGPASGNHAGGAILLGDSHGAALGEAMSDAANSQAVPFWQSMKTSCAPLLGATRQMPKYPQHARQCAAFNEAMFKRIAADPSISTVILSGFWSGSFQGEPNDGQLVGDDQIREVPQEKILRASISETLARYKAAGKRIIVLGDVPLLRFDPARETTAAVLPLRVTLRQWMGAPEDVANGRTDRRWLRPSSIADAIVADVANTTSGVTYFSLQDSLCNQHSCTFANGVPFYIDFQHLSKPGAAQALRKLNIDNLLKPS